MRITIDCITSGRYSRCNAKQKTRLSGKDRPSRMRSPRALSVVRKRHCRVLFMIGNGGHGNAVSLPQNNRLLDQICLAIGIRGGAVFHIKSISSGVNP